jgi:hypothetical protein
MESNVYKIQFFKSSHKLNEEYEKLSEYDKQKISELEADGFFDYDDDNERYTLYVITSYNNIDTYLNILRNNLIKYTILDLSDDILKNKINLENDLSNKINISNYIKYNLFIEDINNWIYHNLDIDMVLDRILEVGMDSLREIEKEFLKEYKV